MTVDLTFRAVSDETRRRILQLVGRYELSVSELTACLRQPQSTVSRHLKVLREAELVRDRREGTTVLYALAETETNGADSPAGPVLEWLGNHELPRALEGRLDRVLTARQEHSTEFFSRVGQHWDRLRVDAFGQTFHLQALASLLPRQWTVADIGSGTGFMLPLLAGVVRRVIAVEPVAEMLDAARRRCAAGDVRNVTFRRGDLAGLPIKDERVDLALAVLVLHHVPSPVDALAELYRIIKPGGQLLIVEQRTHKFAAFQERMQDRWSGFEPTDLTRRASAAGFTDIACRPLRIDETRRDTDSPTLFTLSARRPDEESPPNRAAPVRKRKPKQTPNRKRNPNNQ